jgi:carnitine monooxygenase subunit
MHGDSLVEIGQTQSDEMTELNHPIPKQYYWDKELYEKEKRNVFMTSWRYAGHQTEFAQAGDYAVLKIADESVFVIRGKDGQLRAFYNVFQHRGTELLQGRGNAGNFVTCPYHAWSYDHEGCLRAAVNSENVPGFVKSRFSLSSVRLEIWCGFVFVNLDETAEPLSVQMRELETLMRKYCPEIERLRLADRVLYSVKANWKTVVDNFIESYHLKLSGPAHKAFTDLVDCAHFKVTPHKGGRYRSYAFSTHHAPSGPAKNSAYEYSKERKMGGSNEFLSIHMFPDIGFVLFPGADVLVAFMLPPDGPEQTAEIMDYFTIDGTSDADTKKGIHYFSYALGPEDNDLVERVQRGLRSKGYRQGALMVDRGRTVLSEHAVASFQEQVRTLTDQA